MHTMRYAGSYYSGAHMHPMMHHHRQEHGHGHGFCHGCHHPVAKCSCSRRDCRKESKELLVKATVDLNTGDSRNFSFLKTGNSQNFSSLIGSFLPFLSKLNMDASTAQDADTGSKTGLAKSILAQDNNSMKAGTGDAFIGGSCCAHLSIEYTPTADLALVGVISQEDDDTMLLWAKQADQNAGYQIKENIISTKPGAHLTVIVVNATARIRWCEIFSC